MGFKIYVVGVSWVSETKDTGYDVHVVIEESREQAINIINQTYAPELLLEYSIIREVPIDKPEIVYEIREPRNVYKTFCEY